MTSCDSKICVIVASVGRPRSLANLVTALQRQTMTPYQIILSSVSEEDVPHFDPMPDNLIVLHGEKGSCVQRNAALDRVDPRTDIVAIFDDDYLPSKFCLQHMAALFQANPDLVGANGLLLADGIHGPGISDAEAQELVDGYDRTPIVDLEIKHELSGLYGCNMAFRFAAIADTRFDETLKLYGWQEDIDFASQIRSRGKIAKTHAFVGVHQGVKGGRTSGLRFGYSQVANPVYLATKGTMEWAFACRLIMKNVLANHWKSIKPEPWVDRAGRLKGNWYALFDALRGKLKPEKIMDL